MKRRAVWQQCLFNLCHFPCLLFVCFFILPLILPPPPPLHTRLYPTRFYCDKFQTHVGLLSLSLSQSLRLVHGWFFHLVFFHLYDHLFYYSLWAATLSNFRLVGIFLLDGSIFLLIFFLFFIFYIKVLFSSLDFLLPCVSLHSFHIFRGIVFDIRRIELKKHLIFWPQWLL